MREIEFRGKRIDNGGWVYGSYCHFPNPNILFINDKSEIDAVDIIPESVGQFTGLLDKKSKKIFEGDVIKSLHTDSDRCCRFAFKEFTDSLIGVVVYNERMTKYELKMEDNEFNIFSTEIGWSHEDFEIIGNVTENPELLK